MVKEVVVDMDIQGRLKSIYYSSKEGLILVDYVSSLFFLIYKKSNFAAYHQGRDGEELYFQICKE